LGYTYARTFDSAFADGQGTFPGATYCPLPGTQKADWALSALNLDHQFTASFLYDLPVVRASGSEAIGAELPTRSRETGE